MLADIVSLPGGVGSEPLELRWRGRLPRRLIRPTRKPAGAEQTFPAPPWHDSGPHGQPFDFSGHLRRLLEDIVERSSWLSHVRLPEVLVGVVQARGGHDHGLQARVTPLRFARGRLTRWRRGVAFQVQRYFLDDSEFLYLMMFCLPRFLERSFDDKLVTIIHELYHIGPEFNGDIRRHQGRCHVHTARQKNYDRHMADLAREYLATKPDPRLHSFLRMNFAQLVARHGAVEGIMVPRPRMVPVLMGT